MHCIVELVNQDHLLESQLVWFQFLRKMHSSKQATRVSRTKSPQPLTLEATLSQKNPDFDLFVTESNQRVN